LTVYAILGSAEDGTPIILLFIGWLGPLEGAESALAPLRALGEPLVDTIGEISYLQLQAFLSTGSGFHRYWKSGYFTELGDELVDRLVGDFALRPSPTGTIAIFRLHGMGARVPSDATAYQHRRPQWEINFISEWKEPENGEGHIAWVRNSWQAAAPFSHGVYVNHMDKDDSTRVRAAYGSNYERLAEIKQKYDPDNFFRLNHNIVPAVKKA
jgi:hypothetical protein